MEAQNKTTIFIADCNQGKELADILKKDKNSIISTILQEKGLPFPH